ncbi:MAG: DMT family transporter [Lachnospiraceae bacterium]|nr:DMT family transporter [Lachnospiraceae bacterium]
MKIGGLKERQNRVCYNWGFQFALWCAILWGACYQLLEILISDERFLHIEIAKRNPYVTGTVLAIVLTSFIALFAVIWAAVTGDIKEIRKGILSSRKINVYFLIEALAGGLAAWATYVTAGLLNTMFAVFGVMFYPILGAVIAKKWLREKVSSKTRVGMGMILIGWGLFYFQTIAGGDWGGNTWVGAALGIITGIGWGVEGAIASKVMDMVDSDSNVAVRFLYEAVIWVAIFLLITLVIPENEVWLYMRLLFQDLRAVLMLAVIALALTFNYFSWYRSFTLMGVTEGLVISNTSGFVTVLTGMLLAVFMPAWTDIIACLLMISGIFWIYWYGISRTGVFREVDLTPCVKRTPMTGNYEELPLKARILIFIASNGPIWDFEVANLFSEDIISVKKRCRYRNRLRTYMIESCASGFLVSIEDDIDEMGKFEKGKLLSRYQITEYGYKQLTESGFILNFDKTTTSISGEL